MKVGNMDYNVKDKKTEIVVYSLLAIIVAAVVFGFLNLLTAGVFWLTAVVIEHYVLILIGIFALIVAKRLLFKKKKDIAT